MELPEMPTQLPAEGRLLFLLGAWTLLALLIFLVVRALRRCRAKLDEFHVTASNSHVAAKKDSLENPKKLPFRIQYSLGYLMLMSFTASVMILGYFYEKKAVKDHEQYQKEVKTYYTYPESGWFNSSVPLIVYGQKKGEGSWAHGQWYEGQWKEICETPSSKPILISCYTSWEIRINVEWGGRCGAERLPKLVGEIKEKLIPRLTLHVAENRDLAYFKEMTTLEELNFEYSSNITDAGLEHLKDLTALKVLCLDVCTNISDTGLGHLKGLTSLRALNIYWCDNITDIGLECLKELTALESLCLSMGKKISDVGLEHLKELSALKKLELYCCNEITDFGLMQIAEMKELEDLDLTGCYLITDLGLKHLKGLTKLKTLKLSSCSNITNVGLEYLKDHMMLKELSLKSCDIFNDEGLEHLKSLTGLYRLDLRGCFNITDVGIKNIKKALPVTKILH